MFKNLLHFTKVLAVAGYYLLVAFPLVVSAAVELAWDANDPAPQGYNLYQRETGQSYNYNSPVNTEAITDTSYPVNNLEPGTTYYFVVRAFSGDSHSGDSNELMYTEPANNSIPDSDGDGVGDADDAFPNDPHEWLDTDNDGVGNNNDTDDDGDGMPDSYESQVDGLDPLVDDADGDLDGDTVSNLDEYINGTDPLQDTNIPPIAPELDTPLDGATVSLTPTLTASGFFDPNGDSHWETRFQIALDRDFVDLVFDRQTALHRTSLSLIDLILDPESEYYWRVRFVDDNGGESPWSGSYSFSTVDYVTAGDEDANGILDGQEVQDMGIDLDRDNMPDATQADMLCVNTSDAINPQVSVKADNPGSQVVAVRAMTMNSQERALSLGQPETMTGLISVKIFLNSDETTAVITIYFTSEAPDNAQYYYQTEDGWTAYSNVTFSDDRLSVTISMEDGGEGDQDGVANGVIVDPAGLGYSSQTSSYSSSSSVTEQTTCFIATPLADASGNRRLFSTVLVMGILFGLSGLWMEFRQRP